MKVLTHDPPPSMKRYKWKPWTQKPPRPDDEESNNTPESKKPAKRPGKPPPLIEEMDKRQLVHAMGWEHPRASLNVGTLNGNAKAVLKDEVAVAEDLVGCLREASREAWRIKRKGQSLIGLYVERIAATGDISHVDRDYLDLLCPRIAVKDSDNNDGDSEDKDDIDADGDDIDKSDKPLQFIWGFLRCLYSGNFAKNQGIGKSVNGFINRLQELRLHTPLRSTAAIREKTEFTPGDLLQSVSSQLAVELKKMYRNGSIEMQKKVTSILQIGLYSVTCRN